VNLGAAAWAAAGLLGLLACGDGGGAIDAGAPGDARIWADAAQMACGQEPDAGCDTVALTPVCHRDRNVCVECESDADCAGRDDALGPNCLAARGYCQCEGDGDCAGNSNGPRCHQVVLACSCIDSDDCPEGMRCALQPYLGAGVRTCALAATPTAGNMAVTVQGEVDASPRSCTVTDLSTGPRDPS
jgi:hypothetical protein